MNEAEWWDRYGHLNDQIWEYDKFINATIRDDYLTSMVEFLHKPGGKLLDFGCGTGWFSIPFALSGMHVDALDNSEQQIQRGSELAERMGAENMHFKLSDSLAALEAESYDAILLHAVIHHIPIDERAGLLQNLENLLIPGGRIYIYEPIMASLKPSLLPRIADLVMGGVFRVLRFFAWNLNLYTTEMRKSLAEGWTMRSPTEQPMTLEELLLLFPNNFSILRTQPQHLWSINYANFCMMLNEPWHKIAKSILPQFYNLDRIVRDIPWYHYLRCWPCVSVMAQKNE